MVFCYDSIATPTPHGIRSPYPPRMTTSRQRLSFSSLSLLATAICSAQAPHAAIPDSSRNATTGDRIPASTSLYGTSGDDSSDDTFNETIKPFLRKYCTRCHSKTKRKGDLVLSGISSDLAGGRDMDQWKGVLKQLVLDAMPPAKKRQPEQSEKAAVIRWINTELDKSGNASDIYSKLESPTFGNYVSHTKLFSGEIKAEPFSPARLWRTSPNVFDTVKSSFGGDTRHLRQPFAIEDKMGIKDYANLLFADSAVVNTLMGNAGTTADHLIKTQYSAVASARNAPDKQTIDSIITKHFKRVVFRDSSKTEQANYYRLFKTVAKDGGHAEALRTVLMAVMLHHESVYRLEIGLGAKVSSGRRILSATEMAFAISYALTDSRPDEAMLQAARDGQLRTREDAQLQVKRILDDDSIDKPRTLRFFQEFFGYAQAHKIFKDEKRSGGFAYYGENYPQMYERDADFFVMHILAEDKDVFKRLLTSDKFFILNRQTFRNTVYDFYKQNQQQLDAGEFPAAKQQELLSRLDLKGWHELNKKYFLHKFNRGFNGSIPAIKQIAKECKDWKNWKQHKDEEFLLHGMQQLYKKYPMVYDLADDEQDFLLPQPYKRPNRAGMLTHPAWLIAHSLNDGTDPVRRGKWIREHLLAGVVPDIPITVDATVPENHSKTLRERFAVTEQQECWRCHVKMNPLGYTFEMFDDFGRVRSKENLGDGGSKPIDATGDLQGTGEKQVDGKVKDALDLIQRLGKSDKVRQSIIRHVFRYYMGRNERLTDSKTLIAADQAYLQSGGSYKAVVISLLSSDSFLYRKKLDQASGYTR